MNFERYLKIGDKKNKTENILFHDHSLGVSSNRDPWCINPSRTMLLGNIQSTVEFYNKELIRWQAAKKEEGSIADMPRIDDFVNNDATKISWTHSLKVGITKGKGLDYSDGIFVTCMYRPFIKNWQYYSRRLNERVYKMPRIFPNDALPNRVIAVTGRGGRSGFSVLMMDTLPNLDTIEKGQCFPFWLYEETEQFSLDLLGDQDQFSGYRRENAITEYGLRYFSSAYPMETVTRDDIFHYIYGLLHSEEYRERYSANLSKELPRIPCVISVEDYRLFRDAGKRLGELHVKYEFAKRYPAKIEMYQHKDHISPEQFYRVTKMKHPRSGANKDLSTVIYNPHITIQNIPSEAWAYVVSGKPALSWIMERQSVKTDKASRITSDANRYANETVGNPRYILDLFLRVITVSLETMKIVRSLPELKLD